MQSGSTRYTDFSKKAAKVTIGFDASILLLSGFFAIFLRYGSDSGFKFLLDQSPLVFLIPAIWFVSLAWENAWVLSWVAAPSELYGRVLRAGVFTFGTVAAISFTFKQDFSRGYVLLAISIGTALLILQRKFTRARFIRLCDAREIKSSYLVLCYRQSDPAVARVSSDFQEATCQGHQIDVTASDWLADLKHFLLTQGIDAVFLGDELANDTVIIHRLVRLLDQVDCQLYLQDAIGELALRRGRAIQSGNTYSVLAEPQIQHSKAFVKRILDLATAAVALIFSAPFMAVIALLIKVTSKGKVLYHDFRIGQDGKEFRFPKFRTMYTGADKERLSVLGRPDEDMAERYRADPRITPWGKFLRRFSLDELPQFWCVLVGTMSIVGPRPILKEELPQLNHHDNYRHLARPGLTGLWQVSGRKQTTWDERMALDLEYVQNWSPFTDLVLVLRTFWVVITGKGAY